MYKCKKGHEVKILESAAGFYIGTKDSDGCPYCKLSIEYWQTKEEAENDLVAGLYSTRAYAMEIQLCNGYCGCQVMEVK